MRQKPHLERAHQFWQKMVAPGEIAIDCTVGNGHDALKLCLMGARVFGFDIQEEALKRCAHHLSEHGQSACLEKRCHSTFPPEILPESVKLCVYNLGYLPKGDKSVTTTVDTTLESLKAALLLLQPKGALSITCYPGHDEGFVEEEAIVAWAARLDPKIYEVERIVWMNRQKSPNLIFITKA